MITKIGLAAHTSFSVFTMYKTQSKLLILVFSSPFRKEKNKQIGTGYYSRNSSIIIRWLNNSEEVFQCKWDWLPAQWTWVMASLQPLKQAILMVLMRASCASHFTSNHELLKTNRTHFFPWFWRSSDQFLHIFHQWMCL